MEHQFGGASGIRLTERGSMPEKMIDDGPTTSLEPFDVLCGYQRACCGDGDGDGEFHLYPGVGNINKTPHSARRVVCVGASEMAMLGALELTLTNGGIEPCSDRKPWLLAIKQQRGR
jgi:hypothetical protein